jgi:hypothetical protein
VRVNPARGPTVRDHGPGQRGPVTFGKLGKTTKSRNQNLPCIQIITSYNTLIRRENILNLFIFIYSYVIHVNLTDMSLQPVSYSA